MKKTNPYINIGGTQICLKDDIIGFFDLDAASTKTDTKRYLSRCEGLGRTTTVGQDIPKSFVLTGDDAKKEMVYFTQLSTSSLEGRWKRKNAHL